MKLKNPKQKRNMVTNKIAPHHVGRLVCSNVFYVLCPAIAILVVFISFEGVSVRRDVQN